MRAAEMTPVKRILVIQSNRADTYPKFMSAVPKILFLSYNLPVKHRPDFSPE